MPHKLKNILARVPSDIDIAQAATPIPVNTIAAEAGILPDELELYGKYKAKVHLSLRDRLKDVPNLVCSAHVGGLSHESIRRMTVSATDSVLAVLAGEIPATVINPDVLRTNRARSAS